MRGPRGANDRLAFTLANLYLLDLAAYGGCALAWWPRSHVATLLLLGLQLPLAVTALAIRSETAWTRYLPFHLG